jgi:hypothetical protein
MSTYLNNLFAGEDTPRDGVRTLTVGVGAEIALFVDGVVGDSGVSLDSANKRTEQFRRNEKLEIRLVFSSVKP